MNDLLLKVITVEVCPFSPKGRKGTLTEGSTITLKKGNLMRWSRCGAGALGVVALVLVWDLTGADAWGQSVKIDVFFDTQADDFYGGAPDAWIALGSICGGGLTENVNPGAYQVKAFFRPDVQVYEMRFDTYSADGTFETSTTLPAASPVGDVSVSLAVGKQYVLIVFVTEGAADRSNVASACGAALPPGGENHNPMVELSLSPENPTIENPITFTANASDPDGDELTYEWFLNGVRQSASAASVEWSKPVVGDYTLLVKVSDGKGGTAQDSVQFTVRESDCPPLGAARVSRSAFGPSMAVWHLQPTAGLSPLQTKAKGCFPKIQLTTSMGTATVAPGEKTPFEVDPKFEKFVELYIACDEFIRLGLFVFSLDVEGNRSQWDENDGDRLDEILGFVVLGIALVKEEEYAKAVSICEKITRARPNAAMVAQREFISLPAAAGEVMQVQLEIQQGIMQIAVQDASAAVSIETPTTTVTGAGAYSAVVGYHPQFKASFVIALDRPLEIQPKNPSAQPFNLDPANGVRISQDEVGPITRLGKEPSPPSGNQTVAQALDVNANRLLDDAEIRQAIQFWILGQTVPGANQTIDDALIRQLIQMWILGQRVDAARVGGIHAIGRYAPAP